MTEAVGTSIRALPPGNVNVWLFADVAPAKV